MKDRQNRYFLCLQNSAELGKDIGLESVFKDTIYGQLKQFKDLGKSQTHTHMRFFVDFFKFFFIELRNFKQYHSSGLFPPPPLL